MSLLVGAGIVAAGLAVGILSALFGVGGGLVMVPFLVLGLGRNQHLAQGTSLLVIVPTAIVGVIAHSRKGYVAFKHAAMLAVGGVGGAYAGALLALELEPETLQKIFGVFLAVMGLRTGYQGLKTRMTERARASEERATQRT